MNDALHALVAPSGPKEPTQLNWGVFVETHQILVQLSRVPSRTYVGLPLLPVVGVLIFAQNHLDNLWHSFTVYLRFLSVLRQHLSNRSVVVYTDPPHLTGNRSLHSAVFGRDWHPLQARGRAPLCFAEFYVGVGRQPGPEDAAYLSRLLRVHLGLPEMLRPRCPPMVVLAERRQKRVITNWAEVVAHVQVHAPAPAGLSLVRV